MVVVGSPTIIILGVGTWVVEADTNETSAAMWSMRDSVIYSVVRSEFDIPAIRIVERPLIDLACHNLTYVCYMDSLYSIPTFMLEANDLIMDIA